MYDIYTLALDTADISIHSFRASTAYECACARAGPELANSNVYAIDEV